MKWGLTSTLQHLLGVFIVQIAPLLCNKTTLITYLRLFCVNMYLATHHKVINFTGMILDCKYNRVIYNLYYIYYLIKSPSMLEFITCFFSLYSLSMHHFPHLLSLNPCLKLVNY